VGDALKLKQRRKDGSWMLQVKRKRGELLALLADEGLGDEENAKPGKPVQVVLAIDTGDAGYGRTIPLAYVSKAGKKGRAK
jgi:hypothetical protein